MNAKSTQQALITQRQLRGLMAALTVQFVLGVTLTTLVNYDPNKHSAVQTVFLVVHIIVALGILIGASARFVLALRWQSLVKPSAVGLLSAVAAIAAGGVAAGDGNNVAVFVMSLGFIAAFASYGYSMGILQRQNRQLKI